MSLLASSSYVPAFDSFLADKRTSKTHLGSSLSCLFITRLFDSPSLSISCLSPSSLFLSTNPNMNHWDKTRRENDGFSRFCDNPSFSSSLLDQIYRSIDSGEQRNDELNIFRERMPEKQSRNRGKIRREEEENLRRACLIDKWMDKTVRRVDRDRDVLVWSSTSSDSSSGGFSSSDSDSIFGSKSTPSTCFTPARPKPIRTATTSRPGSSEKKLRDWEVFDDYQYNSGTDKTPKSKALKIYSNLKKVKQPISPGGRLSSFLNSLFTSGNTKKTRNPSMAEKASEASACSSASSFSRSCLSKKSSLSREKLQNGVRRTVRFSPVSVMEDEDCRPCRHKCLFEDDDSTVMPVTLSTAWRIAASSTRKKNDEPKFQEKEQKKESQHLQKQNDSVFREFSHNNDYDDDDDDAASYSSSDLFELDHLAVIGGERFYEDLPVYETTRINTNRAIANGFLI